MRLRVPVDVMILQVLSDGQHANPIRVRYLIETKHGDRLRRRYDREETWTLDYITQRMGELRARDLLERVPPEDSGLYRITTLGRRALDRVVRQTSPEFNYRELATDEHDTREGRAIEPDEIPWQGLTAYPSD